MLMQRSGNFSAETIFQERKEGKMLEELKNSLSMEAIKKEVINTCPLQIKILEVTENPTKDVILEALTGAYLAGMTKGLNLSDALRKSIEENREKT